MQIEYRDKLQKASPGDIWGNVHTSTVLSAINDRPRAEQIVEFAVDAASTEGDLILNSISIAVAGLADENETAEALANAINAEPVLSGIVLAEVAGDTVTVTARVGGLGFTFADGTNTTATLAQANAVAAPLSFGCAATFTGQSRHSLLCSLIETGESFDGVSRSTYADQEKSGVIDAFQADGGSAVNIVTEGQVYVRVEVDVAVGDPVYYRDTADGAFSGVGAFSNSAGTGKVELPRAKWLRGSEDGLAVLYFTSL